MGSQCTSRNDVTKSFFHFFFSIIVTAVFQFCLARVLFCIFLLIFYTKLQDIFVMLFLLYLTIKK